MGAELLDRWSGEACSREGLKDVGERSRGHLGEEHFRQMNWHRKCSCAGEQVRSLEPRSQASEDSQGGPQAEASCSLTMHSQRFRLVLPGRVFLPVLTPFLTSSAVCRPSLCLCLCSRVSLAVFWVVTFQVLLHSGRQWHFQYNFREERLPPFSHALTHMSISYSVVEGAVGARSTNVHTFTWSVAEGFNLVTVSTYFKYFYWVGRPEVGAEPSQFIEMGLYNQDQAYVVPCLYVHLHWGLCND